MCSLLQFLLSYSKHSYVIYTPNFFYFTKINLHQQWRADAVHRNKLKFSTYSMVASFNLKFVLL